MSWEAWGSGDEFEVPDGYVTEEHHDELLATHREAVKLLQIALPQLNHHAVTIHAAIEKWLTDNTVNGEVP